MQKNALFRIFLALCFSMACSVLGFAYAKPCLKTPVRVAISSSPTSLNPFFSTDANSQNLNRLLHISLIDFNQNMEFECRLCREYEEIHSSTGYKVRFRLKKGVTFWDGTEVKAKNVRESWKYYTEDKKIKSIFRETFNAIKDIKVLGPHKLEIVFKEYQLDQLSNLALLKIVKIPSFKTLEEVELEDIVGAGAYKLKERKALSLLLLPKHGKSLYPLKFKVVKDETTLALKLINGEVDLSLANMSPRKSDWLKSHYESSLNFWERESSNFVYIGVNHKRSPFDDREVREALAKLIPRDLIIRYKLKGLAVKSHGIFSKAFTQLYIGKDQRNTYSPKQAKQILRQKGYTEDSPLKIDWKVTSNKSTIETVKSLIQFLEKGPIKVNLTIQEWGTYMRSFKQGRFDLILGKWIGFTGPGMLKFAFHSSKMPPQGGNRGGYKSKKVDRLIEKAEKMRKKNKRLELFHKIMKKVNGDFAYINLWHPKIRWIGRKCLQIEELYPNESFDPLLHIKSECCREK